MHDNEIKLVHKNYDEPDEEKGHQPRYGFSIILLENNEDIGVIYFAVDKTDRQYLRGHLSYGVDPAYRGHNYATKACRLIMPVVLAHGFKSVFIGSGFGNTASRKTIEKLGAVPITISDVPDPKMLDILKKEKIDMFRWDLAL